MGLLAHQWDVDADGKATPVRKAVLDVENGSLPQTGGFKTKLSYTINWENTVQELCAAGPFSDDQIYKNTEWLIASAIPMWNL